VRLSELARRDLGATALVVAGSIVASSMLVEAGDSAPNAYSIAKDFGFPALIALIVLIRLDASLREMTRALQALTRALIRHGVDVDDHHDKEL